MVQIFDPRRDRDLEFRSVVHGFPEVFRLNVYVTLFKYCLKGYGPIKRKDQFNGGSKFHCL